VVIEIVLYAEAYRCKKAIFNRRSSCCDNRTGVLHYRPDLGFVAKHQAVRSTVYQYQRVDFMLFDDVGVGLAKGQYEVG
jgi:hypothetical protein